VKHSPHSIAGRALIRRLQREEHIVILRNGPGAWMSVTCNPAGKAMSAHRSAQWQVAGLDSTLKAMYEGEEPERYAELRSLLDHIVDTMDCEDFDE